MIAFIVVIALTAIISIGLYAYLTERATYPPNVVLSKVSSKVLGQERELIIHLPLNYSQAKKYPVLYVMDGGAQDGHIANKFEVLAAAGCAPETIVVGIPNMTAENRQYDMIPPYMATDTVKGSPMGRADKFLQFMKYELFPYMAQHYSASNTRLFAGHSRGGLLVMYSLAYQPRMFQARFCFSPALWRDHAVIVSKTSELFSTRDRISGFLYLSLGDKETGKMEPAFNEMASVFREQAPKGLTWYADRTLNADHQNNAQRSAALAIAKWGTYTKAAPQ